MCQLIRLFALVVITTSTAGRMKKFTQSIAVAKQATLEKIGKAEAKADTDEAIRAKTNLASLRAGYGDSASALKKVLNEGGQLYYAQCGVLETALSTFAASQQGSTLGTFLSEISRGQRSSNDGLVGFLNLNKERLLSQMTAVVEGDLKKAKELKDRQESARMKLDAAMNEVKASQKKGGSKLVQADAECQAAKDKYDLLTKELIDHMAALDEKIQRELIHQLTAYAEAQLEYFSQGVGIWKTTLDALNSVEPSTSMPPPYSSSTASYSSQYTTPPPSYTTSTDATSSSPIMEEVLEEEHVQSPFAE
eukprot:TRINITY_DN12406_c0_g1_i1.p1 TRINITY_DN12406_c0_g1~~TRINITY_DN12406_c0_g1_i1.p1  ORF type:complete len:307 (-),score=97.73 TRINITY_DN12406_c0_g1_i1:19-939(-)